LINTNIGIIWKFPALSIREPICYVKRTRVNTHYINNDKGKLKQIEAYYTILIHSIAIFYSFNS